MLFLQEIIVLRCTPKTLDTSRKLFTALNATAFTFTAFENTSLSTAS